MGPSCGLAQTVLFGLQRGDDFDKRAATSRDRKFTASPSFSGDHSILTCLDGLVPPKFCPIFSIEKQGFGVLCLNN
ncbi:hypothetical protein AVO44_02010 [Ruegeria profundi]|uniref:Uncharacterized protein n=1 Tax=Ruegeria profundi TaxID=1685378 RepID=A0A0X3U4E4_9RHOB|nr:hypothetical protein AVO44_02010 [Ruegeria profundi]